jgi:reactive intermediate/imine deaminase
MRIACLAARSAVGLVFAAALSAGASVAAPEDGQVAYHRSATSISAHLPFSDAVRVGRVLYLNNQIGNTPGTPRVVDGGLEAQTRQAMANIDAVLAANGLKRRDLFRCTVTLSDMGQWSELNRIWGGLFEPDRLPVRNVIGVTGLPLNALVGIECQAAYPGP